MANFFIVHVNGQIGVGVFQASGFEVLRCNGELWQEFNPESFWGWFIDKAGLDIDAGHGFVIASDQESFSIPATIQITTNLDLSQEAVQQALGCFVRSAENLHLMTYPEGFRMTERTPAPLTQQTPQSQQTSQTTQAPQVQSAPQNNSSNQYGALLRYCWRKMEEYRKSWHTPLS
ncbi:hypothetical protein [Helicobacter salomonis]|uniref:hypothetical protein n=1 Tax=Helicobacter salomonis TaxID=56878 RepID=UPI000CF1268A|nr:hypothetical protein [Helicobacter salomonis]